MSVPAVLRFVVPGEPVPKGRPRYRIVKPRTGAPFVHEYTPTETRAYEDKVRLVAQVAVNQAKWTWGDDDRFSVIIRVFRTHWEKGGDADNYGKSLMDGMNKIVFSDDRYVRAIAVAIQPPDPSNPRAEIEVQRYRMERERVARRTANRQPG